ncbi:hypothetical protein [Tunicatimonas pelagia]|uniref:hypothetical protein n=1 Tax=Tunicatimonas pelagia TaxID=931531 RepID=UPI0026655CE7|nr:hypothetical protein [Tunicatimonas pelagia]WKN42506.1 hypothetical protein P0M28_26065 [Tunicatimonas pelagia]
MWLKCLPAGVILILAVAVSSTVSPLFAQEKTGKSENRVIHPHQVRGNIGFSTSGILSGIVNYFQIIDGVNIRRNPVISATYLFQPTRRAAIGGTIAHQNFSVTYRDPDNSSARQYGLRANRFYLGATGLLYIVYQANFRMYSGARLGFSNWNVNSDVGFPSDVVDRVINFALGGTFAPQLIILGGESYVTEHVGFQGELAIGAPHLLSFGACYRW